MLASYSVFVLEPGAVLPEDELDDPRSLQTSSYPPTFVLYLCIVFGILFLIMLIVNILLCSAMTCSCARTEIVSDKEQSMIEEFDPYTRSWHGSQYGSR